MGSQSEVSFDPMLLCAGFVIEAYQKLLLIILCLLEEPIWSLGEEICLRLLIFYKTWWIELKA